MRRLISRRVSATFAIVVALTGGVAGAAVLASPAYAGVATLLSCSANGSPASIDNWASSGNPGNYSGTYNSCASGGPFGAYVSEQQPQPAGENLIWTFTPPAGSTIVGGSITGAINVPYGQGGGAYFAAPSAAYDGANVLANCQWNLPCPQSAPAPGPGFYSGTWPIHPGGNVYMVANCSGLPNGAGCPGGFGPPFTSGIGIVSAAIQLENDATPGGSGFSGSLLTPNTHGTSNLQFQATDGPNGLGVYKVNVIVDGASVYNATPDANGGKCVSAGTDAAGHMEIASVSACRASEAVDVPVATSALSDGQHQLKVIVTDVAGNSSTVLDQVITTANNTTASAKTPGSRPPVPAPTGPGGAPLGPCNAGCDPHAILQASYAAASAQTPTVTYSRSAMTLSGRLINHSGEPMAGAQVELRQRPSAAGTTDALVATATTTATGSWTLNAPAGPSRLLVVGYRAHLGDPTFATELDSHENVRAAASLKAPKRTRPGQRIVFNGALAGGNIPPGGQLVAMQIYFSRRWRTIDLVHAGQDGRFRYAYVFAGVPPGTYRFRALVPTSPAYPFVRNTSHVTKIEVL